MQVLRHERLPSPARGAPGGYPSVTKCKVGGASVGEDLARVNDALAAMPAEARMRIDANRAWTLDQVGIWGFDLLCCDRLDSHWNLGKGEAHAR
jgi:hypothetical protein